MLSPVAAISLLLALGSAVDVCFPLGPTYPPPRTPSKTRALARALDTFNSTITESLTANGSSYGQLDPNTTSFSLEIFSLHEGQPLFTYHFSAPEFGNATEGVRKVNSSTVYRLGSMSKLLSVYNFLIAAGDVHFNEPITKYVPELATFAAQHKAALQTNNIDYVSWDEVTVGALASQMAGISREEAFGPVQDADLREALGLPEVTSVNASFCGPTNMQVQVPCTRAGKYTRGTSRAISNWVARLLCRYVCSASCGTLLAHAHILERSISDPLIRAGKYHWKSFQ